MISRFQNPRRSTSDLNARLRLRHVAAVAVLLCVTAPPAAAQQSISDVLSFFVTNQSIATGDFVRDEQAAAATRDAISRFLALELATRPVTSAGGFTYRLDPALGTVVRSSNSFGPFVTERSLTVGRLQGSVGMSYRSATFDNIDGRSLRDGTLVSTASILRGDPQPFDVETVSLQIQSDTITLSGNLGVTDRLDISAAVPFVSLSLRGERIDTYRGEQFLQATGSASASGPGDIVLRAKYNVLRRGASGLAVGGETRLPTGSTENLLGSGQTRVRPHFMASFEGARVGVHGDVGYSFSDISNELDYSGAVAVVAAPRVTLVGELSGRRLDDFGRLASTIEPHPQLAGVDTIRLTSVRQTTDRIVAVMGFKWNVAGASLVNVSVLRPLTDVGLNASWVPTVTFDYSFGR